LDDLLAALKAVAEITRLRILAVLSQAELNVKEITFVLEQSQPRVSRHLKLMAEAGLIDRHKEGNWVLFRLSERGQGAVLARALVGMVPGADQILRGDATRLDDVRRQRQDIASAYFKANASNWAKLRSFHVRETDVEAATLAAVGSSMIDCVVDLGTGTGRMLELLSPQSRQLIGIDSSREMLAFARANIERLGLKNAQLRHGDIYALPIADGVADLVCLHQVLHFLDDPQRAIQEARRIMVPGARLVIVDFAPHEMEELRKDHAHRRLGFSDEQVASFLTRAGLKLEKHQLMPPPRSLNKQGLTVSFWLARLGKSQGSNAGLERMTA
jgi:ubiquinone/menaquinone biosynthesis C-methylase UbiE/DNA-binding transcriptional ArsR family regulator